MVVGAIAVLYYYGSKMKGSPTLASGGDVGGSAPSTGNQPSVPPTPAATPSPSPPPSPSPAPVAAV